MAALAADPPSAAVPAAGETSTHQLNSVYYPVQQQSQRDGMKSVYYVPQQQPSQQQLNPFPQGSQLQQQQLPYGAAPVIMNTIETPPGVKLVSFQQEVTAQIPQEFQQQSQQMQQALQQHQQKQANAGGSGFGGSALQSVSSDYHFDAPRAYGGQLQQQQPQGQGQQQAVGGADPPSAAVPAAGEISTHQLNSVYYPLEQQSQRDGMKSVYYVPQQQPSQQQLNPFPQGSQLQQQQLPSGAAPVIMNTIETPPGVKLVSFQQEVTAQIPQEFQQQSHQMQQALQQHQQKQADAGGSGSGGSALQSASSDYHFDALRAYGGQLQQQPQGQDQQQAVGGGGGSTLQGSSSDYHFGALRGLYSAY